jgi:hypothetical protein
LTRKKDKVENEKEVGDQDGFHLADGKSEDPSLFLQLRPVIKPCPKKDCQKYPPPFREVTLNQS